MTDEAAEATEAEAGEATEADEDEAGDEVVDEADEAGGDEDVIRRGRRSRRGEAHDRALIA